MGQKLSKWNIRILQQTSEFVNFSESFWWYKYEFSKLSAHD